jgi:hypothetical protein
MSVEELLDTRRRRRSADAEGNVIAHIPESDLRIIVNGADMVSTTSDKTGSAKTSTCDGTCVSCC